MNLSTKQKAFDRKQCFSQALKHFVFFLILSPYVGPTLSISQVVLYFEINQIIFGAHQSYSYHSDEIWPKLALIEEYKEIMVLPFYFFSFSDISYGDYKVVNNVIVMMIYVIARCQDVVFLVQAGLVGGVGSSCGAYPFP